MRDASSTTSRRPATPAAVAAAQAAALARGYFAMLAPAYREQRGARRGDAIAAAFDGLVDAPRAARDAAVATAPATIDARLLGFRAAPLGPSRSCPPRRPVRSASSPLVPVEYGRGISDGRVTKATSRSRRRSPSATARASAFADLESVLITRDAAATRAISATLDAARQPDPARAARGGDVADPDDLERTADDMLDAAEDSCSRREWHDAAGTADFDVIEASLDRLEAAVKAGSYGTAEQARLEAYAFFEFGPEQRLRGLAPEPLPARSRATSGTARAATRASRSSSRATRRRRRSPRRASALDRALSEAEQAIGAGPANNTTVITNTAIVVFREGLEAVLILAVLTASMVGAQRRLRRPLYVGAARRAGRQRRSRGSSRRRS